MTTTVNITKALGKLDRTNKAAVFAVKNGLREAGVRVLKEVRASIKGSRAEPRSIKTGLFRGSTYVDMKELSHLRVSVRPRVAYAKFLEYGTMYFRPRRHFRNSAARMQKPIKRYFSTYVKSQVRRASR